MLSICNESFTFSHSDTFSPHQIFVYNHGNHPSHTRRGRSCHQEYDHSNELRQTFWDTIPKWILVYESEPTQVFLEWMRFGLFLKPEWRPANLSESEAESYWKENVQAVEIMLQKYGEK
ncbi:hypothetical protein FPOAC1_000291 [Fusarium poae]|uniref:hypothetical protein n=1 Tax=Fusarium poae TaxID=36050 RepID=UPI001CEBBDC5|nr:hypothetical protein FPOAC1_000291 [Fusarium poae]KAG8674325.1 hypothetical protein FPOAC1_000291 [Fusarium poae]